VNTTTIPVVEMPSPLAAALQTLRERERDAVAAEAAVVAARESVTAAREKDIEDVAAAREAGRPDPRAKHEEKAEATLAPLSARSRSCGRVSPKSGVSTSG
jgi:hypothetical protein